MDDEAIGDHETRRLLLDHIRDNPGISFQLLRSTFKLKEGTLRYHLGYLIKRKGIVLEKKGRERCYYSYLEKHFPLKGSKTELNARQKRILAIITEDPGVSLKDIRKRSKLDKASFEYNFRKLKDMRLIWRVITPKGPGYEVITKERLTEDIFIVVVKKFLNDEIDKRTLMEILDGLEEFRDRN